MDTDSQPILTTSRLNLRRYRATDFDAVHSYATIPEVSQYMAWGPNTEEDTRGFIERCVTASAQPASLGYFYAITLRNSGLMIGGCDLVTLQPQERTASMGYCLHPDYWGNGYTTESATALLKFGFDQLGLHRVTSYCDPDNMGSYRVMEKVGMRKEGHEREAIWFKGRWHDWLRYAILEREWTNQ